MRIIPGEYYQTNIVELVNTCELIMIDLYSFSQEHIYVATFSCYEDLDKVIGL